MRQLPSKLPHLIGIPMFAGGAGMGGRDGIALAVVLVATINVK